MSEGAPGRRPWGRFLAVAVLVGLDLATKAAVFSWLGHGVEGAARDAHGHLRYVLIDPWLGLMKSCNPGAAFGQFGEHPHLLVGGRVLAIGILGWLLWNADRRHRLSFAAVVLVLAGAVGNLCDNFGLGCEEEGHPYGLVRDFIDVWFVSSAWGWDWHFPTFNAADSCITVGAIGWVLSSFVPRRREESEEGAGEPLGT